LIKFYRASRLSSRIALVLIFPLIVFALYFGITFRLNAIQPSDGLNCDATRPSWPRVLGYAGITLFVAVPTFIISCLTAARLIKVETNHLHTQTLPPMHTVYTHSALTSFPSHRRQRDTSFKISPQLTSSPLPTGGKHSPNLTPSPFRIPKTLLPEQPGRARSISKASRHNPSSDNHLTEHPSAPASRRQSSQSHYTSNTRESPVQVQDRSRHESYQGPPSPIIFNPPSRAESHHHPVIVNVSASPPGTADTNEIDTEKDDASLRARPYEIDLSADDDAVSGPLRWAKDADRESIAKVVYDYAVPEDEEPGSYAFPPYPRIRRSLSGGQPPWLNEPPDPDPSLGCIVFFQLACSSTQILASISSLIDIFSRRSTPTRVGTQHVALLLATWVPVLLLCMSLIRRFFLKSIFRP